MATYQSASNGTSMISNATDSTHLGALYLLTSFPVIVSNGIVVVVVVTSKELHISTLWNIAFMAFCDFLYGLHYIVFAVPSAFMNRFAFPEYLTGVSSCLLTLLYGQNVLNVVVTTVDRYISVCWPLKYKQIVTPRWFTMAVITNIVLNACRLCLMIFPNLDFYYNHDIALTVVNFDTTLSALFSVGFPAVSVIIIVVLLGLIFSEIVRSRRRFTATAARINMFKFTVTVSMAAGVFCLSYVPTSATIVWSAISGVENVPKFLKIFATSCTLSNSLWNIIIYTSTYRPFKNAFLRLFCQKYHKRKRQMQIQAIYQNRNRD